MKEALVKAMVSDIQKFSLHDGPGIRSTVFLKGCNMTCLWCHNPEAISFKPELAFYSNLCIGCGKCYEVCPSQALRFQDGVRSYDKSACKHCFACAQACVSKALVVIGKEMSAKEVFDEIKTDKPYYDASGGGVTVSGGEPLCQAAFLEEFFGLCKGAGIHTAMETNLSLPWDTIQPLLPLIDFFMFDIKSMDDAIHKKTVGITNETVLKNAEKLASSGKPMIVRTPLIPGVNSDDVNIARTAKYLSGFKNLIYYELLNYNPYAESKYNNIGLEYYAPGQKKLREAEVDRLVAVAQGQGAEVFYGKE